MDPGMHRQPLPHNSKEKTGIHITVYNRFAHLAWRYFMAGDISWQGILHGMRKFQFTFHFPWLVGYDIILLFSFRLKSDIHDMIRKHSQYHACFHLHGNISNTIFMKGEETTWTI